MCAKFGPDRLRNGIFYSEHTAEPGNQLVSNIFEARKLSNNRILYIKLNVCLYVCMSVCMCVRMFRIENSISEPIRTKLGTHTLRAPAGVIGYFSSSIDIDFIDFYRFFC